MQLDAPQCCTPTLLKALSRVQPRPPVRAVPGEAGHKSGATREERGEISVVGSGRRGSLPVWRFGNEDAPHGNSAAFSALQEILRVYAMPPPPLRTGGAEADDGHSNGIDSWQGGCRTFSWRLGIPLDSPVGIVSIRVDRTPCHCCTKTCRSPTSNPHLPL